MKYLLACLLIPTVQMLFAVVLLLGALYFGMEKLLTLIKTKSD